MSQVKFLLLSFTQSFNLIFFYQVGPLLDTGIRRGKSMIGQEQLLATPSTSQNYGGVTNEPNKVVNHVVPNVSEMLHMEDPNEEEIGIFSFTSVCLCSFVLIHNF